uniref:CREG-like beta-barrel domain-containing protein n=1 Tax=Physcomitrium patens TaxID=3218 RepID=A0A7I4C232_PHYPA
MATAVTITITLAMLVICASGAVPGSSRPDPSDAPATARWLVAQSAWGVLSTISIHLEGAPWGNVAAFSDGPVGSSGGTPFFYLSRMDPTPNDITLDSRCSLTLSEASLGTCGSVDPENPTCARLTLSGKTGRSGTNGFSISLTF